MLRTTSSLYAEGHTPASIRALVREGVLRPIRRGAYAETPLADDPNQRHEELIAATWPRLGPGAAISHLSAAVLHQLPVWRSDLTQVTVTRPSEGSTSAGGTTTRLLRLRRAPLPAEDLTDVNGMTVTTMVRTVIDLGRTLPMHKSVAVLDAALRTGLQREELEERAAMLRGAHGVGRLRVAIEFADGRAESPAESFSRVVLHRLGIPKPQLQVEVFHSRTGVFLGRPDFLWPELRVTGEFDGKGKYEGTFGRSAADEIMAEKRREAAFRADGWGVTRWGWADLYEEDRLMAIWRAEARAA
ncbi:hypothetical protein [Mariniluteicoccus flavus]